jgi:hypothetical protein
MRNKNKVNSLKQVGIVGQLVLMLKTYPDFHPNKQQA